MKSCRDLMLQGKQVRVQSQLDVDPSRIHNCKCTAAKVQKTGKDISSIIRDESCSLAHRLARNVSSSFSSRASLSLSLFLSLFLSRRTISTIVLHMLQI